MARHLEIGAAHAGAGVPAAVFGVAVTSGPTSGFVSAPGAVPIDAPLDARMAPQARAAAAGATAEPAQRRVRMLRTAMGPEIAAALEDPDVVEVLLNPDGTLWVDRLGTGRSPTGASLAPAVAERIVRLVAAHVRAEVHAGQPILSAELPDTGERFLGVLPPVVRAPSFAIRKHALRVLTLQDYQADGILDAAQAAFLRQAVQARRNILVAGGTSTGKTTFANALLAEIARTRDRVLVLEDTLELRCLCDDHVSLRTEPGVVTLADLVRATLRLRPDRIVVGEVRGPEALELLKAWGTGHPGGIATVHAGSAAGALVRLEQLVQEVSVVVPRALIAEAVHVVVVLQGRGRARRVREIVQVTGYDAQGYRLLNELAHEPTPAPASDACAHTVPTSPVVARS